MTNRTNGENDKNLHLCISLEFSHKENLVNLAIVLLRFAFIAFVSFDSRQTTNRLNRKERKERKERKGKSMKDLQSLCTQVRQTAYDIHIFGSYKFEMRKFARSPDAARRKSKPTFLLSSISAFFAFFAV